MFWITEDPSSGSLVVQCLAKNYKNDSILSVGTDIVGVMAAYSDPLWLCSSLYMKALIAFIYSEPHSYISENSSAISKVRSMYGDQPQWLKYFLVLIQLHRKKAILMSHHIIMCNLRKKCSTTLCFTWYAINIYQCRDVALGHEKVVK